MKENRNRVRQQKQRHTGMLMAFLALLLVLTGVFAWFYVTNAVNEFGGRRDDVNSAVLHDDFDEKGTDGIYNKDVYVENTGTDRLFVRVRLDEYMEIAEESLIDGADKMDESTWLPHKPDGHEVSDCTEVFHDYWEWQMGGDAAEYARQGYGSDGVVSRYDEDGADTLIPGDPDNARTNDGRASGILTIMEYDTLSSGEQEDFEGWIMDADGYAYWYVKLDPELATGLLLDEVRLSGSIPDGKKYYYGINVILETVNEADLDAWLEGTVTKDGKDFPDEVGTEAMKRYLKRISDRYKEITDEMNQTTPPAGDYDHDGDGFLDPDELEEYEEAKRTTLESIAVKEDPDKMIYLEGSAFDPEGMVLELTYGDKHTEDTDEGYEYEPKGGLAPEQNVITITYEGLTTTLQITVNPKTLTEIRITNEPYTKDYIEEQVFDPAGMEVTAYYDNGTEDPVTDYTYEPDGALTTGDTKITVSYGGKTADQAISVRAKQLTEIRITNEPYKKDYIEGQVFDPAGMEVTAYYDNDTSAPVSGYTWTPDGALTTGDTKITVSYGGKTADQAVSVRVRQLTEIRITNEPYTKDYIEGQTFDPAGMVVTAYYDNDTSAPVSDYTYMPPGALTTGDTKITVSYGEKTAEQAISVRAKQLTGIEIVGTPNKSEYFAGEYFDPTGITVWAYYDNGTSEPVSGYLYSTAALTAGTTKMTITYGNYSKDVAITVKAVVVERIAVTGGPGKTSYEYGDTLSTTGLVVTAYYNNGTSKPVTSYSVSPTTLEPSAHSSSSSSQTQPITVSYSENGVPVTPITFNVTVTNPLQSISLNTSGAKTTFAQGSAFSYSGLVVTAKYKSDYSRNVTGYNVSTPVMSTTGTKTVTVSYTESVTKSATYSITVVKAAEYELDNAKVGETITLGGDKWIVLNKSGGQAELLREELLPEAIYFNSRPLVHWKDTYMRSYLNGVYLKSLSSEITDILVETTRTTSFPGTNVSIDGDSTEKIYLLSSGEFSTYQDAGIIDGKVSTDGVSRLTFSGWWLRSSNINYYNNIWYVDATTGRRDSHNNIASDERGGVRPAMTVKYK